MPERFSRIFAALSCLLGCLLALGLAAYRPWYFNNYTYLQAVIFIEIVAAASWKYQRRFFPFLIVVFLWAGIDVPLSGLWTLGRWLVLGLGAAAGCVIYLRQRNHFFGVWHMVAFSCVIAALISAMASAHPQVALLKAVSLMLLFLYGAAGARIAVVGREASFFSGLLLGCEILVYLSAVCYFVLHLQVYGNPNAMGAVMGIGPAPILLWGVLISEGTSAGWRRTFALVLCLFLLFASYARAGMAGAAVSSIVLCVGLRRYRLLIKGVTVALLAAFVAAAVVPLAMDRPGESEPGSFVSAFLYKGHEAQGLLGSRESPWEETSRLIQEHPWFGSGFGTSSTPYDTARSGMYSSTALSTREHGNSYLAILESEGLLGIIPFFVMVCMIVLNVGRVVIWMRRTGSAFSPAVPLAAVLAAGLVHAAFEDWLFSVGSYLCVFYWPLAFMLADMVPSSAPQAVHSVAQYQSRSWVRSYGIAPLGR
jgi:O-antigen ligase